MWRLRSLSLATALLCSCGTLSLVAGMPAGGVGMPATNVGGPMNARSSTDVAGYQAKAAIDSIGATFAVPKLKCPGTGTYETDVSVQVVGGLAGGSFVQLKCTTGAASYTGTLVFSTTQAKAFTVASGNSITTDITLTASTGHTTVAATVTNGTTGAVTKKSERKMKTLADTSAWFIVQRVNGTTGSPIPPFGTLRWSGASVNGGPLRSASYHRYVMVNSSAMELVSTQQIGATGGTFTNKFVASS